MAMSGSSEVVSLFRHEVKPGSEDAYEAWVQEVRPIAQRFPGHQGVAMIRPQEGSHVFTIVLHFDTLEHLRAWLDSDTRQELLRKVEPLLSAQPAEVEIRPGMEFWLSPPGQKHARAWKQFLLITAVIYPVSVLTNWIAQPLFDAVPMLAVPLVRSLIISVALVALMTWAIMPRLTRAVAGWLYE
jgi:uncharacterized protein